MGSISLPHLNQKDLIAVHTILTTPPLGDFACAYIDIISSTNLWEHNEAEIRNAFKIHKQVIRNALAYSHEYEVKIIGDGFMLVWGYAGSSLHFATSAQLELHVAEWPAEIMTCHKQRVCSD